MRRQTRSEHGYSLVEALVVVAIIGLVSLVTVPNFITYMRSAKLKSSARQFAVDVREARQRAVTQYRPVKIGFKTGSGLNSYILADGEYDSTAAGGIDWTVVSTETLDETVYFSATTLADGGDSDAYLDVLFLPTGTIMNGTDSSGNNVQLPSPSTIAIKTDDNVPKDTFTLTLESSGQVRLD